jgi:hypothetical protein
MLFHGLIRRLGDLRVGIDVDCAGERDGVPVALIDVDWDG